MIGPAICTFCNTDAATEKIYCTIGNCGGKAVCCPSCHYKFQCNVCEQDCCDAHMATCGKCNGRTCALCARRLPGKQTILDLNCFDQATSKLDDIDIIGVCPLAKTLPKPDYDMFDEFDPPIELLTYSESKTARKRGVRPDNVQAEHFIPNSCFIVGKGRSGATVHGSGSYAEAKALTYWVDDDQVSGTEHKFLTDMERNFCRTCESKGQFPTLEQWLDFMQFATTQSILLHRDYAGDTTGMTASEIENVKLKAAQEAAYGVRYKMEKHFVNVLGCDLGAHLGNGVVGGSAPPKKVSTKQEFDL